MALNPLGEQDGPSFCFAQESSASSEPEVKGVTIQFCCCLEGVEGFRYGFWGFGI